MAYSYSEPIRIVWRAGTTDDPYVAKTDTLRIVNNKAVLFEIPWDFEHVQIVGTEATPTTYYEVFDKTPASNEFVVDYMTGAVTFNATEEAKTIKATYKGKGIILYPAERVYVKSDNPDVVKTLQDIVDSGSTSSGGGTVTSVSSPNGDISVTNPTTDVQLAINTGISANQIVKLDANAKVTADILTSGITNKAFTATDKTKLDGIEAQAQKNTVNSVNGKTGTITLTASDVSAINNLGGIAGIQAGLIANRPTVGTINRIYIATDEKKIYRDTGTAWEVISSNVETQLNNHISNTSNPHNVTASQVGAIPTTEKGTASGVASLDSNGKLIETQLSIASNTKLGGVKIGSGINIDSTGIISVTSSGGSTSNGLSGDLYEAFISNGIEVVDRLQDPTKKPSLSQAVNNNALPEGTYYVTYTWADPSAGAETKTSPESTITVTAGNMITITLPTFPTGVTNANIYISTSTGTETKQGTTTTTTYVQSVALVNGSAMPTSSTFASVADPTVAPTLAQSANTNMLASGTYYVVYTWLNSLGETLVSPSESITISTNNYLIVNLPTYPTGATKANVYISSTSGSETKQGETTSTLYEQYKALVAGTAKPSSNTTKYANKIDVGNGIAFIKQISGLLEKKNVTGNSYVTSVANSTYYLDINPDATISWGTGHSANANRLEVVSVSTDASGNITAITELGARRANFLVDGFEVNGKILVNEQGQIPDLETHKNSTSNPHNVTHTQVGAEKVITKSSTAPSSPSANDLWLDLSVTPNLLKRWDASLATPAWVKASATTASEVNAIPTSEKGVASGVATLDGAGTIPDAQIPSTITRDTELSAHTGRTDNPHGVTASQVGAIPTTEKGVANGVSTLDANGTIPDTQIPSSITRDTELSAHTSRTDNPHAVTHTQIGAEKTITKSATAPASPVDQDLWIDTSSSPNLLKRWDGTLATPVWVEVGASGSGSTNAIDITIADSGSYYTSTNVEDALQESWQKKEKTITKSTTAPSSPITDDLWIDISVNPHVMRRWDGTIATPAWIVVGGSGGGSTSAIDINITDSGNHFTATNVEDALQEEATARKNHSARTDNPHSVTASQVGAIPTTDKGIANGVASLDANALIPDAQIPSGITRDTELSAHTGATNNPHNVTYTQTGGEKAITKSTTAPASPADNDLWVDKSVDPNLLKRWDASLATPAWVTIGSSSSGSTETSTSAGKMELAYNLVTIATDGTTNIPIGITFDKNKHILAVFKDNIRYYESSQWVLNADGISIDLQGFSLLANDQVMFYVTKFTGQLEQEAWQTATMENSWVGFDASGVPQFYKDSVSITHIRGRVKTGAIGTTIFTLPVGYRPTKSYFVPVRTASNGIGLIQINADGTVQALAGNNTDLHLDNIHFRAEQ